MLVSMNIRSREIYRNSLKFIEICCKVFGNKFPSISTNFYLFLFPLLLTSFLYASRSSGMGGTYVASGDDIEAIFHNPAGLHNIKVPEIFTNYTMLYPNLSDGSKLSEMSLAVGLPFRGFVPAFGYFSFGGEFYKEEIYSF